MSIERFRSVADMTPPKRPDDLLRAMAAVWERAHLHGRVQHPAGVRKFRSIEAAQLARDEETRQRVLSAGRR
jgi:hypothetical protein